MRNDTTAAGSNAKQLQDIQRKFDRLKRDKDAIQERLRLEERVHETTMFNREEDFSIAKQRYDALNAKLQDALAAARKEKEERERLEERLRMLERGSAWTPPSLKQRQPSATNTRSYRNDVPLNPPRWLIDVVQDLLLKTPSARFNLIASFGENGRDEAEWKVECADCPYEPYAPNENLDFTGTPLADHLRSQAHHDVVHARLGREIARRTAEAPFGTAIVASDPQASSSTSDDSEKVHQWRHTLQKAFLTRPSGILREDVALCDLLFQEIERYEHMSIKYLSSSKIGKVMRHIHLMDAIMIPGEDRYNFRGRAKTLIDRWQRTLHEEVASGTD